MKLIDKLNLVFTEFKKNKKYIVLNIILISILFMVSIYIIVISFYFNNAQSEQLNKYFPDGIEVNVDNLKYEKISFLEKFNLERISVQSSVNSKLKFYNENNIEIESSTIKLAYLNDSFNYDDDNKKTKILKGQIWTKKDNEANSNFIWMEEKFAETHSYKLNDTIKMKYRDNELKTYVIRGIYKDVSLNNSIIMPFISYAKTIENQGLYVEYKIYGLLEKASVYYDLKKNLLKEDIYIYSNLDEIIIMLKIIFIFFIFLAIIIIFMSAICLLNFFNLLLDTRKSFIFMLKILGAKNKDIFSIYYFITEAIILVSIIIAGISAYIFTKYSVYFVEMYFGYMQMNKLYFLIALGMAFVFCNLFIFISFAKEYISMKNIDLTIEMNKKS